MEDFLLTLTTSFVDTDSGEVLTNGQFSKPLSQMTDEDWLRYFHSFKRGIHQGRKVALYVLLSLDRALPEVKQSRLVF